MSPKPPDATAAPIRIGVSACLLGDRVRHEGGHKRDAFLADTLARHVEFVKVCPEVELGLGTPRATLQLHRRRAGLRLLMPATGQDLTEAMMAYAARRVDALARFDLCGYVLKKNSPSCGLGGVRVFTASGRAPRVGTGFLAAALRRRLPHLPIEEEDGLADPRRRGHFIERVLAYGRLKNLFVGRWTIAALRRFHAAHDLLLLAHAPLVRRELGRLVGRASRLPRRRLRDRYAAGFMQALAHPATRGRHVRVLRQALARFRDRLDAAAGRNLLSAIDDYGRGAVPLAVPVRLIRESACRLDVADLAAQVYLEPERAEVAEVEDARTS
jgi:uncharacterized protein YbbK (DUF523 family)/uncharacterized protein YbgA (DUF1722 family)